MSDSPIVNRVANSGLITINLESFFPTTQLVEFDLKDYLFKELILKEKDFRMALKTHHWEQYKGHVVCVFCSTDAIIPQWAYMLVAAKVAEIESTVFYGNKKNFIDAFYRDYLSHIDYNEYEGKRVVIKGCSHKPVPTSAYVLLTAKLQPLAQSIMYGEPCSTVPVFKRPRKLK